LCTDRFQGIGAAVAIALAQQGASVVIDYVSPSSKALAEGVAKTISELELANGTKVGNGKTLVVQADMAKLEDIDRIVKETVDMFGKIDILVSGVCWVDQRIDF
jgi:3-oxoacyl-[acyl-carrier protein] reductase